jgi:hypothetical protein
MCAHVWLVVLVCLWGFGAHCWKLCGGACAFGRSCRRHREAGEGALFQYMHAGHTPRRAGRLEICVGW